MSFIGYLNSPISIPPTFDTTPCLEHLTEYEDCVIDVGSNRKEFFMPAWPTLWPGLENGDTNITFTPRPGEGSFHDTMEQHPNADYTALTTPQKQLLYECEEERMVVKACMRELITLKRNGKHTSWETADAANMGFT